VEQDRVKVLNSDQNALEKKKMTSKMTKENDIIIIIRNNM